MTHDPLCPFAGSLSAPSDCETPSGWRLCYLIGKVREDMLAQCIAAVDEIAKTYPSDSISSLRVLAALRALQEKS